MDNPKSKRMLYMLGGLAIVFLLLLMFGGKSVADAINKVAAAFGLPEVAGIDVNTGANTYNIPGLKVRNGCGQSACSFNIIPLKKNAMGLATPYQDLLNDIAGNETIAEYVRSSEDMITQIAPPFYPFSTNRMVGGN